MNRWFASLKDKRFRYGTLSTVMILFAVGLFVLVNLVVGQFDVTADLTLDKTYSLSDDTLRFIKTLDKDVTIYALYRTGGEDLMFKQLLEEYAAASTHIKIEYRDPVLYPTFVEKYAAEHEVTIKDGSFIVESGGKSRVVPADALLKYQTDIDPATWQQYVTSVDVELEPLVSNAINYVTLGVKPIVYHVSGNQEVSLSDALVKQLDNANFELREADLLVSDLPEDCAMLLITSPARDWSPDKAERVLKYLQGEGKALFVLGHRAVRFPNMDGVLAAYGIRTGDYVVYEGDSRYIYFPYPNVLLPMYVTHDITQVLGDKKTQVIFPGAAAIEELALKKPNTVIEQIGRAHV